MYVDSVVPFSSTCQCLYPSPKSEEQAGITGKSSWHTFSTYTKGDPVTNSLTKNLRAYRICLALWADSNHFLPHTISIALFLEHLSAIRFAEVLFSRAVFILTKSGKRDVAQ
jgi:hypothetical protein